MHNETCETSQVEIAAKAFMNISSSLIKVEYNSQISHESFRESFGNKSC